VSDETAPTGKRPNRPKQPRGRNGAWGSAPETAEMDAEAARLRSRGLGYREIAAAMGCDVHTAHDRVSRALAAVRIAGGDELVKTEMAKLDRLEQAALRVLEQFHYVVSEGRVVKHREGRGPAVALEDTGPVLAAVKSLQSLSESRRKLLGLDAAIRTDVSGGVTYRFENVSGDDL
jgi:hypothetical protein